MRAYPWRFLALTATTALAIGAACGNAWGAAAPADLDAAAVRSYLSEIVPPEMAKAQIQGVAIFVTQSGHVIAAQGFGRAGRQGASIDAEQTVFRAGSMSKPITAALVLQLAEEGKVELDHDVSDYVGFTVPKLDGRAVTLREILTHSTGFSDTYRLLFATDPSNFGTLQDYARNRLPPLLFPPGTQSAYSNYAFGLAGYLVERLRGQPFSTVARERIFKPLAMTTATFRQPPEAPIAARLAPGFRHAAQQPGPFEYVTPESAGGLSVSASDYARFVRALIGGGSLGGERILRADTTEKMLTLQPGTEGAQGGEIGMGLGVTIDRTRENLLVIGHSGDTVQYHSEFRAYRERGLVIVAMQNTEGPPLARTLIRKFEERFGLMPPALSPLPNQAEDHEVAGTYGTARYSGHSFLRVGHLFQLLSIATVSAGGIRLGAAPEPLTRVGPGLYQDLTRTGRRALFFRDSGGAVRGVRVEPYQTMLRIAPWQQPRLVFGVIGVGVTVALVALLGVLGRLIWSRVTARPAPPLPWRFAALSALALVLCVAGLFTTLTGMQADLYSMNPGRDPWIRAFEAAGIISVAAWAGFLFAILKHWARTRRAERIAAILFAAGMLAALAELINYHVLTSTLNY